MDPRSSKPRGPKTRPSRHRRPAAGPVVERLEGRALMSVAGGFDSKYGTDGLAEALPIEFQTYDTTRATALDSNGDLVAVGATSTTSMGSLGISATAFLVVRYTASGQLDSTFQSSPIQDVLELRATNAYPNIVGYGGATGVAIEPNGDIVVVGEVTGVAEVVVLNTDGTLDTSFGTGGVVTLGTVKAGDSLVDYASAVAVLNNGTIAIGGTTTTTTGQESPAVEMLNADGSVDTSFGTNGVAVATLPANAASFAAVAPVNRGSYTAAGTVSLVAQGNGTVDIAANAVLPGNTAVEDVITQFTAAGVADTSFGTAGQVTITAQDIFPTATTFAGSALGLDPNGELVVGGGIFIPGQQERMVVARLTTAGALDTSFGYGGLNILPAQPIESYVGAIAFVPQASVLSNVGETMIVADAVSTDFYRLNGNGTVDASFGTDGVDDLYGTRPTLQTTQPLPYTLDGLSGTIGLAVSPAGMILAASNEGGVYGLLSQGAPDDFDNDGVTDRSIEITSAGIFAYTPSGGGIGPEIQFGIPGAGESLPAPGAYGGEGVDEPAVYLPAYGEFAILNLQTNQVVLAPFGLSGPGASLPAPGDYDGSGATELAIYAPSSGVFAYRPADGGSDVYVQIAPAGTTAIPVPGDYFGTGKDDMAVYVPSTATFLILNPITNQVDAIPFGIPGDSIALPGDYDDSGVDELAVWIPSVAAFVYRPASESGDVAEPFGLPGLGATLPAPGDYDHANHTEIAGYLPSTGVFVYRSARGEPDVAEQLGIPNATIPFTLASGTDVPPQLFTDSVSAPDTASVEIPLTPDVIDSLDGPLAKKKDAAPSA